MGCAASRQAGARAAEASSTCAASTCTPTGTQAGSCQYAFVEGNDAGGCSLCALPTGAPPASKGAAAAQKGAPQAQKRAPPPPPLAASAAPRRFFPEFKLDIDAMLRAYDNAPEGE